VALKKLVDEKPLKSVRLWGKIFGTQKNYIIVEGELKEGATDEDDALANPKAEEPKQEAPPAEPVEGQNPEEDERDAPKPKQKPSPYLPVEQRAGANKYVYYVCNYGKFAF
jgi:radial spoke head protein 4A